MYSFLKGNSLKRNSLRKVVKFVESFFFFLKLQRPKPFIGRFTVKMSIFRRITKSPTSDRPPTTDQLAGPLPTSQPPTTDPPTSVPPTTDPLTSAPPTTDCRLTDGSSTDPPTTDQ